MERLLSLGKHSLDKRVKKFVKESSTMPSHQFNRFRTPFLPKTFESCAKMDAPAQARENALTAVRTSFNYALMGGVRVSESVVQLDDLVPDLQLRMATLDGLQAPVYISPAEDRESIIKHMDPGQQPFADPWRGTAGPLVAVPRGRFSVQHGRP